MDKQLKRQIEEVVFQALENKYPVSNNFLREETIRPLLESLSRLPLEKIPDVPDPVVDIQDDAKNQITTLIRLIRDWGCRPIADIDLETIHLAVFGREGGSLEIRTTEYVEDFDGEPPTRLTDLKVRLEEINQSLLGVDEMRSTSLESKSVFLASLFSKIVASHIFADGNGRVARTAIQYCLRRWGMDLVALPKVRNAVCWKRMLHTAFAGETGGLANYIHHLNEGKTVLEVEQLLLKSL